MKKPKGRTERAERDRSLIDENLRKVYEDTLSQELPDRFRLLLDQLRERGGGA